MGYRWIEGLGMAFGGLEEHTLGFCGW